jgi:hypothetical protein
MNKNKVVITSNFDAGNMARCEQMESGNNVCLFIFTFIFTFLVQYMGIK